MLHQFLYCIRTACNTPFMFLNYCRTELPVITLSLEYDVEMRAGVFDIGNDPLTVLDDDSYMPLEDEAVGMTILDGFVCESRGQLL